uniref:Uncharacterized protein n=1 Tax=Spongospora subterranea TaxID=70186 RepID=A0A0H5QZ98_9EUKA|eukprot:CRZ07036.1 hypothetical protein [Spongospora subterranea]
MDSGHDGHPPEPITITESLKPSITLLSLAPELASAQQQLRRLKYQIKTEVDKLANRLHEAVTSDFEHGKALLRFRFDEFEAEVEKLVGDMEDAEGRIGHCRAVMENFTTNSQTQYEDLESHYASILLSITEQHNSANAELQQCLTVISNDRQQISELLGQLQGAQEELVSCRIKISNRDEIISSIRGEGDQLIKYRIYQDEVNQWHIARNRIGGTLRSWEDEQEMATRRFHSMRQDLHTITDRMVKLEQLSALTSQETGTTCCKLQSFLAGNAEILEHVDNQQRHCRSLDDILIDPGQLSDRYGQTAFDLNGIRELISALKTVQQYHAVTEELFDDLILNNQRFNVMRYNQSSSSRQLISAYQDVIDHNQSLLEHNQHRHHHKQCLLMNVMNAMTQMVIKERTLREDCYAEIVLKQDQFDKVIEETFNRIVQISSHIHESESKMRLCEKHHEIIVHQIRKEQENTIAKWERKLLTIKNESNAAMNILHQNISDTSAQLSNARHHVQFLKGQSELDQATIAKEQLTIKNLHGSLNSMVLLSANTQRQIIEEHRRQQELYQQKAVEDLTIITQLQKEYHDLSLSFKDLKVTHRRVFNDLEQEKSRTQLYSSIECELRRQIVSMKEELSRVRQEANEVINERQDMHDTTVANVMGDILQLQRQLASTTTTLGSQIIQDQAAFHTQLTSLENELSKLRNKCRDSESDVQKLTDHIKEKDHRIQSDKTIILMLHATIDELTANKNIMQTKVEIIVHDLEMKNEEVGHSKAELDDRREAMNSLISSLRHEIDTGAVENVNTGEEHERLCSSFCSASVDDVETRWSRVSSELQEQHNNQMRKMADAVAIKDQQYIREVSRIQSACDQQLRDILESRSTIMSSLKDATVRRQTDSDRISALNIQINSLQQRICCLEAENQQRDSEINMVRQRLQQSEKECLRWSELGNKLQPMNVGMDSTIKMMKTEAMRISALLEDRTCDLHIISSEYQQQVSRLERQIHDLQFRQCAAGWIGHGQTISYNDRIGYDVSCDFNLYNHIIGLEAKAASLQATVNTYQNQDRIFEEHNKIFSRTNDLAIMSGERHRILKRKISDVHIRSENIRKHAKLVEAENKRLNQEIAQLKQSISSSKEAVLRPGNTTLPENIPSVPARRNSPVRQKELAFRPSPGSPSLSAPAMIHLDYSSPAKTRTSAPFRIK